MLECDANISSGNVVVNFPTSCYNKRWDEILQNATPLLWKKCSKCGSKLLAIQEDTTIINLPCKCRHCKKISLITLALIRAEK